jgi:hypothetical protein
VGLQPGLDQPRKNYPVATRRRQQFAELNWVLTGVVLKSSEKRISNADLESVSAALEAKP